MSRTKIVPPTQIYRDDSIKEEESKENKETKQEGNKEPPKSRSSFFNSDENDRRNYCSPSIILLFLAFLTAFILIPVIASKHIDLNNLTFPFDANMRACGGHSKNYTAIEYPYIYFPQLEEFLANEYNVCVKECPKVPTPANTTQIDCLPNQFIQNCDFSSPQQIYDTFPAFGRICVPTDNKIFKTLQPFFEISSIEQIVLDSTNQEFVSTFIITVIIATIIAVIFAILPCCFNNIIVLGSKKPTIIATLLQIVVIIGLIFVCVDDFQMILDTNSMDQKIKKLMLNNRPQYFHVGLLVASVLVFVRFVYQWYDQFNQQFKVDGLDNDLREANNVIRKQKLLMYSIPLTLLGLCVIGYACWAVQVLFALTEKDENSFLFAPPFQKHYSKFISTVISILQLGFASFLLQVLASVVEFKTILLVWDYKVSRSAQYISYHLSFTEQLSIILEDAFKKFFRVLIEFNSGIQLFINEVGQESQQQNQFQRFENENKQEENKNKIGEVEKKIEEVEKEEEEDEGDLVSQMGNEIPEGDEEKKKQQKQQAGGFLAENKNWNQSNKNKSTFTHSTNIELVVVQKKEDLNNEGQMKSLENQQTQRENTLSPTNKGESEQQRQQHEQQQQQHQLEQYQGKSLYPIDYFLATTIMQILQSRCKESSLNDSQIITLYKAEATYAQRNYNGFHSFLLDSMCYCISFLFTILSSLINLDRSAISDESAEMLDNNSVIKRIPLAFIVGISCFNLTSIIFSIYHDTIKYCLIYSYFYERIQTLQIIQLKNNQKANEKNIQENSNLKRADSVSTNELESGNVQQVNEEEKNQKQQNNQRTEILFQTNNFTQMQTESQLLKENPSSILMKQNDQTIVLQSNIRLIEERKFQEIKQMEQAAKSRIKTNNEVAQKDIGRQNHVNRNRIEMNSGDDE